MELFFIRYKYIMAAPVSNNFSAQGIQYSKDTSYYTLNSAGSGLGVGAGVSTVNGAAGTVVIAGANGVAVSSGPTPTISLGNITPLSVNTPGTIQAELVVAPSATFNGSCNMGAVLCNTVTSTGNIQTPVEINCGSLTASAAVNVASMAVSGALSAGSFNATGALGVASFTPGSLGATTPFSMAWATTNQATMVIAGWRFTWGMALPSDTAGNITVAFTTAFASPPTLSTTANYGVLAAYVTASASPTASGFSMTGYNGAGTAVSGVIISWIAVGQA
jgi:hypothetical protein